MDFVVFHVFSNALFFFSFCLFISWFRGTVNLIFLFSLLFLSLLVLVVLRSAIDVLIACFRNLIRSWIKRFITYYFSVIFRFVVLLDQVNFDVLIFFRSFHRSSPIFFFLIWVISSSIFLVATSRGLLAGAIFLRITVLLGLVSRFRYVDFGR